MLEIWIVALPSGPLLICSNVGPGVQDVFKHGSLISVTQALKAELKLSFQ